MNSGDTQSCYTGLLLGNKIDSIPSDFISQSIFLCKIFGTRHCALKRGALNPAMSL